MVITYINVNYSSMEISNNDSIRKSKINVLWWRILFCIDSIVLGITINMDIW